MPIVNIRIIEGASPEQKVRLVEGVTELLHQVLAKEPDRIYVVIDEVPFDNWGAGGVTVTQRREQGMLGLCGCGAHEPTDMAPAEQAQELSRSY